MVAKLRSHLRHNVVGYLALFVALGGSGYATHERIFSSDIVDRQVRRVDLADGAVTNPKLGDNSVGTTKVRDDNLQGVDIMNGTIRSVELANGAVRPSKLDVLGYAEVAQEESTSSGTFTDLETVGPTVTVNVPPSGLVAVFAQVDMKLEEGANSRVAIFEPTSLSPEPIPILRDPGEGGAGFLTVWTVPGYECCAPVEGTRFRQNASWIVFAVAPGVRTFRLQYLDQLSPDPGPASFRNRKLWVMAIA